MESAIRFALPQWAAELAAAAAPIADEPARMRFVIDAARRNVDEGTGGPFAAAVFDGDGRLVSLGVNLVTLTGLSILHAEMVAISLAQAATGGYDLASEPRELVSSAEPCAMCLGAVAWSGVSRLVAGARGEDVEKAGFDEGAKPGDWPAAFSRRGIEVVRDIERAGAAKVIADYAKSGGVIYNSAVLKRP